MEDSPIGLDKWMVAFWMLTNCRNGVSSYEIKRAIGVSQKCTWHMLHRIRLAMTDLVTEKFGTDSPIEIDETFVGGKVRNMHKSRREKSLSYAAGNGKAIVMGMLERGGRVRARVIADRKVQTMRPVLEGSIERGANVITDARSDFGQVADFHIGTVETASRYSRVHPGRPERNP